MGENPKSLSTSWPLPDAAGHAARAGVTIRTVESVDELNDIVALVASVWGLERGDELVNIGLLRAMSHTGNYVAGAFAGQQLAGACIGFLGSPIGKALHSHISGVVPHFRGRGIGAAMKLHQREWTLERGLSSITWTFDPLVALNAHLNIVTLGAKPEEYMTNFYGSLTDNVNAGERTDRILVRWDLLNAQRMARDGGVDVLTDENNRPVRRRTPRGESRVRVQLPRDILTLRTDHPALAQEWREAVGDAITHHLAEGWRIVGFDGERRYILERP